MAQALLTGSSLHIYRQEPAVTRQIELMRAIYASGTPCFGSCWGIQVGAVAAGGTVVANPKGREIGLARRITLTEAGRSHPLLAGRPLAFDAPAIHLDTIAVPPPGTTVLASNAYSTAHAAQIEAFRVGLLSEEEAERWLAEIEALDADKARHDLAWAHGLDEEVLDEAKRVTELRNFLEMRVKAGMGVRGRG